jgi:ribosomal protein S18 acetylase RimI-like enzyme
MITNTSNMLLITYPTRLLITYPIDKTSDSKAVSNSESEQPLITSEITSLQNMKVLLKELSLWKKIAHEYMSKEPHNRRMKTSHKTIKLIKKSLKKKVKYNERLEKFDIIMSIFEKNAKNVASEELFLFEKNLDELKNETALKSELTKKKVYIAYENSKIQGICIRWISCREEGEVHEECQTGCKDSYISCLATHPDNLSEDYKHKRKNVGTSLLLHIASLAKEKDAIKTMSLRAYESAQGFYEHVGFENNKKSDSCDEESEEELIDMIFQSHKIENFLSKHSNIAKAAKNEPDLEPEDTESESTESEDIDLVEKSTP